METIRPVILKVPPDKSLLSPREKGKFLSRYARCALAVSAESSGLSLPPVFEKSPNGAPVPVNGVYWSVSHKPGLVAGVAASEPVGIDVEEIRPVSPPLFRRVATAEEWALGKDENRLWCFFRFWTAKEAVLKAAGTGLRDLGRCRIAAVLDPARLRVAHGGIVWEVVQLLVGDGLAAVTGSGLVAWTVMEAAAGEALLSSPPDPSLT